MAEQVEDERERRQDGDAERTPGGDPVRAAFRAARAGSRSSPRAPRTGLLRPWPRPAPGPEKDPCTPRPYVVLFTALNSYSPRFLEVQTCIVPSVSPCSPG